jgi:hypothetical protein
VTLPPEPARLHGLAPPGACRFVAAWSHRPRPCRRLASATVAAGNAGTPTTSTIKVATRAALHANLPLRKRIPAALCGLAVLPVHPPWRALAPEALREVEWRNGFFAWRHVRACATSVARRMPLPGARRGGSPHPLCRRRRDPRRSRDERAAARDRRPGRGDGRLSTASTSRCTSTSALRLGPSGPGKTTLIDAITSLVRSIRSAGAELVGQKGM